MMLIRYTIPCLVALLTAAPHDSDAPRPVDVAKIIETFQPPWPAPKGELKGIVIVFDPVIDGPYAPRDRRCEELGRMTPAYLYHLIKQADGDAVVVENGCAGALEGSTPSAGELVGLCGVARCHLVVRIAFDSSSQKTAPASSEGGRTDAGEEARLSRDLAACLAKAIGASGVVHASSCVPGVPAAEVRFRSSTPVDATLGAVPLQRTCAELLYKGIAAFVLANRAELEANRLKQWPDVATATSVIPHVDIQPKAKVERAARLIWPEGKLPLEKAPWYCATYRAVALSDRTIVYFEPQVVIEGDTVVLRGAASAAVLCKTMETTLKLVGIERVRNEMRVLPDRERLGENLFGVCVAPMTLTFAKPLPIAHPQTQILYGEPLFLLDHDHGHYLVQAGDGYWGWVRDDAVRPMAREPFRRYTAPDSAVFLRDLDLPDARIYRGSRLPVVSRNADAMKLMRPDGREIDVPVSALRVVDDSALAGRRVQAALKMLYTPYVFGGRSPIGLDCSGLIGNVSEQGGLTLARDAAEQFAAGRLVATSWYHDDIRPGDRLYFLDAVGKVHHTGLAISSTHFVHSSVPQVQISSLQKGDRLYSAKWDQDFVAAKRP